MALLKMWYPAFDPTLAFCQVRYRERVVYLILLAVLVVGRAGQQLLLAGSETGSKTLQAVFSEQPPQLDGDLSDTVWQSAQPISDFILEEPVEGGPPTEETEIRVLYTLDALYFGVKSFYSELDKITANERGWDFQTRTEDGIWIAVDPSHGHRDGYEFRINPLGAQSDSEISDGDCTSSAKVGHFGFQVKRQSEPMLMGLV